MPQRLGPRSYYKYVGDGGDTYSVLLDDTLATLPGTGLVLDDGATGTTPKPQRFKPRVVFWQSNTLGLSAKQIICGTIDAALYAAVSSSSLTIEGEAGRTSGRRGEKLSYGGNPPPPPP